MLYWGLDEQARHEHMSDEYKDLYIIIALLKNPSLVLQTMGEHHSGSHRTDLSGYGQTDKTKDLPNTYSRSTAETTMNPIVKIFQ